MWSRATATAGLARHPFAPLSSLARLVRLFRTPHAKGKGGALQAKGQSSQGRSGDPVSCASREVRALQLRGVWLQGRVPRRHRTHCARSRGRRQLDNRPVDPHTPRSRPHGCNLVTTARRISRTGACKQHHRARRQGKRKQWLYRLQASGPAVGVVLVLQQVPSNGEHGAGDVVDVPLRLIVVLAPGAAQQPAR